MTKNKKQNSNSKAKARNNNHVLESTMAVSRPIQVGMSYVEYNRRNTRVQHRTGRVTERVGAVIGVPDQGFATAWAIPVNPGIMLDVSPHIDGLPGADTTTETRLRVMSRLYSQYKLHGLKVKYIPAITSFSNGEIIITYDSNALTNPEETDKGACQHIHVATQGYTAAELNLDDCVRNEFPNRMHNRTTAPVGVDLKTYDSGVIHVYVNGITAAVHGHLEIEYDISFYGPDTGHIIETGDQNIPTAVYRMMSDLVACPAGTAVKPQLLTEQVAADFCRHLSVRRNGETGPLADSPAMQITETGKYMVEMTPSANTTTSPPEASLIKPYVSFYKYPTAEALPSAGVLVDEINQGAWEQALGGVESTVNGAVKFFVDAVKGEVFRWVQNFTSAMTIARYGGESNLLSFTKLAARDFSLYSSISGLGFPEPLIRKESRKIQLKQMLSMSSIDHPKNRAIKHSMEVELAKILFKESTISNSARHEVTYESEPSRGECEYPETSSL